MTKRTNKYAGQKASNDDKELQLIQLRRNLENSEKEIEMISKTRDETQEKKDLLVRMIAVRKKMHANAMKNYVNIRPVYKFQADPDYLELQKELSEIEFKFDEYKTEGTLQQLESNFKSFEEQIKSQTDVVAKLKEQIAALEKGE